jgi:hypothetical protein
MPATSDLHIVAGRCGAACLHGKQAALVRACYLIVNEVFVESFGLLNGRASTVTL